MTELILTAEQTESVWTEIKKFDPAYPRPKGYSGLVTNPNDYVKAIITNNGNIVAIGNEGQEVYINGKDPKDHHIVKEPCFHRLVNEGLVDVYIINNSNTSVVHYLLTNQKTKKMAENKSVETPQIKEFVIDVKNIDIKKEIKHAVVDFSKMYVEANLERALSSIVQEEVKKLTPNFIKIGDRKEIKIEGRLHAAYKDCLFLCQHERQLFISGPAGSGKTTLGEQIAQSLQLKFYHISCSAGLSEAHLLGRMLFDGTYVASDFVTAYENGGIFLFDEIDAADANTLLTLNSGLANGMISIPNRKSKTHAKRHKDFICIAAANTWGHGSFEYHGRNHLDAAFLDRFSMSKVQVDYDVKLEKDICSSHPELAEELWKIRANCEKNKIRKIVSTRAFISGVRQITAGKTINECLERFFIGWTKEEKAKVLIETPNEKVAAPQF